MSRGIMEMAMQLPLLSAPVHVDERAVQALRRVKDP